MVEDADRITERGADALRNLEEPAPKTVWVLCAPTPDDVIVTIRSRTRLAELATPSNAAIAELLQRRDQVPEAIAQYAARIAQGHIGRARALARSGAHPGASRSCGCPGRSLALGACLTAASNVVEAASEEASQATTELDSREKAELSEALGAGTRGVRPRSLNAALRDLEEQRRRAPSSSSATRSTGC